MQEFNNLLKQLNITRKEFSDEIGLTENSLGAMLSTGTGKRNTPKWVKGILFIERKRKERINKRMQEYFNKIK